MSACGSVWTIGYAMMLVSKDINEAFFWRSVSVIGFSFFAELWLYFALLLNNKEQKIHSVIFKVLVFVPGVVYIIIMLMNDKAINIIHEYYGWIDLFEKTIYQWIYNIIFMVYFILGAVLLVIRGRNSQKNRVKRQTRTVLVFFNICLILTVTTDIVLPVAGFITFPAGVVVITMGMFGVYYTIIKHKMMAVTPKFISEYIFNTVNEPIFILNEEFIVENSNRAAVELTDFNNEELNERQFQDLISNNNLDLNSITEYGYLKIEEVAVKKKNGDSIICELSGRTICDEYRDILGIMIMLHDISEKKKIFEIERSYTLKLEETNALLKNEIQERIYAEEKIKHFVYYDALTELPNRKKMLESMNELIENKNEAFAVLFIDLDGYKSINDNFGHLVGDNVLKIVAAKLKNILETKDIIYRIGGDEFIIILGNLKYRTYIKEISEKIQATLKEPIVYENENLYVGASIGISVFPEHGIDTDALIKNADLAMYEVKYKGGYGYVEYCSKMSEKAVDKLKMKRKLNKALKNKEFIIYYQPIIDLKNMKILNCECLIRWKNEGTILYPPEFVPIAKKVGEMVAIDNWLLENACIQCKKWHEKGAKNFIISVNTSYTQLIQADFISYIEEIVKTYSFLPEYLNIEITEDEAMEAPEVIIEILTKLKNMGIKISLDDFGTGYSSFSYINKLPIDKIKIDRSLIINLEDDYKNIMIIQAVIKMAHSLNIKVVAEGIETKRQFNTLKELECDFIQGFLIGKPMEASEFQRKFIEVRLPIEKND